MALPKKIQYPLHSFEIPSTKQKIKLRPFTGKEEKLFLLAKADSENIQKIQDTMLQVISNCLVEVPADFDMNKLALYDIEWLYLQLHSISVDPCIDFTYNNTDCGEEDCPEHIKCKLEISNIKVQFPEKTLDNKIVLYDSEETGLLGVKLKHPTAQILSKLSELAKLSEAEQTEQILIECIEYFFDKENTFVPDKSSEKEMLELRELISGFTFEQNRKIREFIDNVPTVAHTLEAKCPKCQTCHLVKLSGLQDFFL